MSFIKWPSPKAGLVDNRIVLVRKRKNRKNKN